MHTGSPRVPIINVREHVYRGEKIAKSEEGRVYSPVHASISGTVTKKKGGENLSLSLSSSLLGAALKFREAKYSFIETIFASIGYFIVTIVLSFLREKINDKDVPKYLRDYSIMLIALSIISLSVYCF